MAIRSGFFNHRNNDRVYTAQDMSSILDGLVKDGIIQNFEDAFSVSAIAQELKVSVGTGRAWFNHTWTYNDAPVILDLQPGNPTYDRYDAVMLCIDSREETRANSFKIKQGAPGKVPIYPEIEHSINYNEYPLAFVLVPANAHSIGGANVISFIGREECPFITPITEQITVDTLIKQWNDDWINWKAEKNTDYNEWTQASKDELYAYIAFLKENYDTETQAKLKQWDSWYATWTAEGIEERNMLVAKWTQYEADMELTNTEYFNTQSTRFTTKTEEIITAMDIFQTEQEEAFRIWMEGLEELFLDPSTATRLQFQINELKDKMPALEKTVNDLDKVVRANVTEVNAALTDLGVYIADQKLIRKDVDAIKLDVTKLKTGKADIDPKTGKLKADQMPDLNIPLDAMSAGVYVTGNKENASKVDSALRSDETLNALKFGGKTYEALMSEVEKTTVSNSVNSQNATNAQKAANSDKLANKTYEDLMKEVDTKIKSEIDVINARLLKILGV